ncbi:MAG TPA: hypothetical protein ACFYD3_10195, partial [Candidatus Hypogeohydataceae bacterium YC41]
MKQYQDLKSLVIKSKKYNVVVVVEYSILFLLFVGLICVPALASAQVNLGPNLLNNTSFESVDIVTNAPYSWYSIGFVSDSTVAHTGSNSYRVKDANLTTTTYELASQRVSLKKGTYRISAWVKLQNVGGGNSGVRLALRPGYAPVGSAGVTATINGTSDWQYIEVQNINITQDTKADFRLETYYNPTGTIWLDDVELHEELQSPPPPSTASKPGGLTAYPYASVQLGPNLSTNTSFETIDSKTGTPSGWSGLGFTLDSTVAHTGSNSYRVKDANLTSTSELASQTVSLKTGTYRISAWIKLQNVGSGGKGVRLALRPTYNQVGGAGITATINGTSDWRYLEARNIIITQDTKAYFRLETYGNPTGTVWFDDVELHEELPLPIEVFCLYPNYRGMLFDDQPQIARFNIKMNPPNGTSVADYSIHITTTDETSNSVEFQPDFNPSQAENVIEVDCSSFINDNTYLVRFYLVRNSDQAIIYEHPAYRIAKLAGTNRSSMTMSFDVNNRFLVRGSPTFILGVYDSGMAYTDNETTWETQQFGAWRRLFDLPINFYLNYMYALAPVSAMTSMMNVLQRHGVLYLQSGQANQWRLSSALITTDDSYATALASHTG